MTETELKCIVTKSIADKYVGKPSKWTIIPDSSSHTFVVVTQVAEMCLLQVTNLW